MRTVAPRTHTKMKTTTATTARTEQAAIDLTANVNNTGENKNRVDQEDEKRKDYSLSGGQEKWKFR